MTKKIWIFGLLGPLLSLGACGDLNSGSQQAAPDDSLHETGQAIKRTTDPDIAIKNLDALIAGMDRQLAVSNNLSTRQRFFDLMALRVQLLGHFSDLATMKSLATSNLETNREEELLFFARYQVMVHEFARARELLSETSPDPSKSSDLRRTLDLALLQNLPFWLETTQEEVISRPEFETYVNLASVQAALGLFEEADESYEKAEEEYSDVSPFPLAWLAFQRGLMWSESAGRSDLGERHYRIALRYLPQYVVANVHLAELVREAEPEEALYLYETAAGSEDPEPVGKLANFWEDISPEKARGFRKQATGAYDALLDAYPLAFADHAAEYFSGAGQEPARGVELSLQNLSNRRTPRAFLVALGAAEAARDTELLCHLAVEARPWDESHPVLKSRLDGLDATCAARE